MGDHKKREMEKRARARSNGPPVPRDPEYVANAAETQRRLREEFLARQKAKREER